MRRNRQFRRIVFSLCVLGTMLFGLACLLKPYYDVDLIRFRLRNKCQKSMEIVVNAVRERVLKEEPIPITSDGRLNFFELCPEVCEHKEFVDNAFFKSGLSLESFKMFDLKEPFGICDIEGIRNGTVKDGVVVIWHNRAIYGFKSTTTDRLRELLLNLKEPKVGETKGDSDLSLGQ